jgi:TonB family protein
MPQFPGVLKVTATGVLELVIDAAGTVESARLIESVHPRYDESLLGAARKWQYQPAQLDGTAVRYSKRIQISLTPPPSEASRR